MRYLFLFLLLISFAAHAQTDTLFQAQDSLMQKAQIRKLDSLEQSFEVKSDSIKQSYTNQVQKIQSLKDRYRSRIDSLKALKPDNPFDTLSSKQQQLTYLNKVDSLDQRLATVQQQTAGRIDSLKGKISGQLAKLKLPKEAEGKVSGLAAAMDKVNVPSFDENLSYKLNIPGVDPTLPNLTGSTVSNLNVPGSSLSGINTNLPGADIQKPDLNTNLPNVGANKDRINDITGKAGNLQQEIKEATSSQEALGKSIEAKAADQLKALPDQKLPDVPGMPGEIPKTGDEAKQQLITQAKKQAINHFAGKEAVLMNAMEKMSKYKQKYESVNSLKDIKDEKWHNAMKGKPLRERLVPAITWQFQSWHDFMLDINPSVGYKLNSNIVIGLGWNQRISFNVPARAFNRYSNVHGFRSYGEYNFKKGFGFRLDLESMNTPKNKRNVNTDVPPQREWVWSALMGIKQKYPIYKNLKGNAQLMYNLFDKNHRSPYTDRINWRIGLEFNFKKKAEVR